MWGSEFNPFSKYCLLLGLLWICLSRDDVTACYRRSQDGNNTQTEPDFQKIKQVIQDALKCYNHPGLAVAIVKDGKTVFSQGFGVTNPKDKVPVTSQTRFSIASLTKAFTAALMVDVIKTNGRFSIDTPLRDILGDDFRFADAERTQYATPADLLSHAIGLPGNSYLRFDAKINRTDYLRLARFVRSKYSFRARPHYSSLGYGLAAAITEKIGGKPWEDLVQERIFKPLGMDSSLFAFSANFSSKDIAGPYATDNGRSEPIDPLFTRVWNSRCGSGCILSTADDMAKWMNFHLSLGKNAQGHQVFDPSEMKTLHSARSIIKSLTFCGLKKPTFPETFYCGDYALGWKTGFYDGYRVLTHTGSTPGYASFLTLLPTQNFGIFVVMNGDDSNRAPFRNALSVYLIEAMMGRSPWVDVQTMCSFPEPWAKPRTPSQHVYDVGLQPTHGFIDYIGAYKHEMYGEAFVNYNSSTSSLQLFYGLGSWRLYPQTGNDTFYGKGIWTTDFWDLYQVNFEPQPGHPKNITRLVLSDFDHAFPPIFEKQLT